MPTTANLSIALNTLQEYLEEKLIADEQFKISAHQQAPFLDVVLLSDEPTAPARVGRAYVLLSGTDKEAPEWGHSARKATIAAPCKAADGAGGKVGKANPDAIQTKIAHRIAELVQEDYARFRDEIGFFNIECAFGRGGQTNDREPTVTTQELTITFVFLVDED